MLRQLHSAVAQTSSAQHSADVVVDPVSNPKGKQAAGTDTSSGRKRKSVFTAPESGGTVDSARSQDFSMARVTQILQSMGVDSDTKFKFMFFKEKIYVVVSSEQ